MVAEGYKETEIGVIPVEWDVVKLNSLGKIITGSTPKTSNQDFYLNGTRLWASPSDLGRSKEVKITNTKLSDLGFEQIRVLDKRSILITCIGSTIGKMGIAYEEMSSNQQINAVTCNDNNNPDFYYYVLFKIKDKIQKLAGTQAVPLLNKTDFSQIKVIQPPLKEQEKIADILSTADDKIDAIASQIQKAQTLKKGLLQKLLSEGIGHSEFKDSELGKIPESWVVVELSTITTILLSNVDKKSKKDEQDVKLCNYMDVYNNQYITNDLIYMEATAKDNQIEKFQLQIDDVIITKDSETKDDIAIPAVVKETFENLICGYHLAVLRPKEDTLYGVYLMKAIQSLSVHKHFEKLANGITRFGLTSSAINQALIPLPPFEEQKQIADILSTADEKLEVLRAKKEKYETLKKGLLQKLLSGEVRV